MSCEIRTFTVPYTEDADVIKRPCSLDFYIPQGIPGAVGPTGPVGPQGPQGEAPTPIYAYAYNTTSQAVAIGEDVDFGTNGPITGITHVAGTSAFTVNTAGVYEILFSTTTTGPNQFSLTLNGSVIVGSIFGNAQTTPATVGMIVTNINAGDVITLRNFTSTEVVTLDTATGGTAENTNASIIIKKIG